MKRKRWKWIKLENIFTALNFFLCLFNERLDKRKNEKVQNADYLC